MARTRLSKNKEKTDLYSICVGDRATVCHSLSPELQRELVLYVVTCGFVDCLKNTQEDTEKGNHRLSHAHLSQCLLP